MSPILAEAYSYTVVLPFGIILTSLLGFSLLLVAIWLLVVIMIGKSGDWHRLAGVYSTKAEPRGLPHHKVLGFVGKARYKFMLTVHVSHDGFSLEVPALFRPGHPRLFIPWSAVSERGSVQVQERNLTALGIGQPRLGVIALDLPDSALHPVS